MPEWRSGALRHITTKIHRLRPRKGQLSTLPCQCWLLLHQDVGQKADKQLQTRKNQLPPTADLPAQLQLGSLVLQSSEVQLQTCPGHPTP